MGTTADLVLDLPTLMVATALVVAFAGALLMLARRGAQDALRSPGPRVDVALIWGASMVTGALGFAVTAFGQGVDWIVNGLGTALFLAAVALSWVGARAFSGRTGHLWLAAVGPILWLLATPLQAGILKAQGPWITLACTIGVAYTIGVAVELHHTRKESLPSRPIALALLFVHAAIYAVRAALAAFDLPHRLWDRNLVAVLTLESLLHSVGMAFLMLALLKERAELRSNEQLRQLTLQDGLTGIANRRHFDQHLNQEIRRAIRAEKPIALLMMDVDRFKAFNDALGHQEGDECLRAVATCLRETRHRPADFLARYGGEEFVMLMPDTDLAGAMDYAETLRAGIEAMGIRFPHPRTTLAPDETAGTVTISIGAAALVPKSAGKCLRQLVHRADVAMYAAKAAGRNTVRAAPPDRP